MSERKTGEETHSGWGPPTLAQREPFFLVSTTAPNPSLWYREDTPLDGEEVLHHTPSVVGNLHERSPCDGPRNTGDTVRPAGILLQGQGRHAAPRDRVTPTRSGTRW